MQISKEFIWKNVCLKMIYIFPALFNSAFIKIENLDDTDTLHIHWEMSNYPGIVHRTVKIYDLVIPHILFAVRGVFFSLSLVLQKPVGNGNSRDCILPFIAARFHIIKLHETKSTFYNYITSHIASSYSQNCSCFNHIIYIVYCFK